MVSKGLSVAPRKLLAAIFFSFSCFCRCAKFYILLACNLTSENKQPAPACSVASCAQTRCLMSTGWWTEKKKRKGDRPASHHKAVADTQTEEQRVRPEPCDWLPGVRQPRSLSLSIRTNYMYFKKGSCTLNAHMRMPTGM